MNKKSIIWLTLVSLVVLTAGAWAADVVASTGTAVAVEPGAWVSINAFLDKVIALLSNPLTAQIVTVVLGLLGGGKWLKNRSVQRWAELAFHTVEEMAATHQGNEKLDKVATFTEVFRGYMKRAGWLVVTQGDVEQAHAIAKSVNTLVKAGSKFIKPQG